MKRTFKGGKPFFHKQWLCPAIFESTKGMRSQVSPKPVQSPPGPQDGAFTATLSQAPTANLQQKPPTQGQCGSSCFPPT